MVSPREGTVGVRSDTEEGPYRAAVALWRPAEPRRGLDAGIAWLL